MHLFQFLLCFVVIALFEVIQSGQNRTFLRNLRQSTETANSGCSEVNDQNRQIIPSSSIIFPCTSKMGLACGIETAGQEKEYDSLATDPYDVRIYPAMVVAETNCEKPGFSALLEYVGMVGVPENTKTSFSSSAPGKVEISREKLSFVLPVLKANGMVQIILSPKYASAEEYPVPSNPEVSIKTVAQRIVAVYKFRGSCDHERCLEKLQKLHRRLVIDNLVSNEPPKALIETVPKGGDDSEPADDLGNREQPRSTPLNSDDALVWVVAKYHPPWILPFLRRNEVWIELNPGVPVVAALIDQAALKHADVSDIKPAGPALSRGQQELRDVVEGECKADEADGADGAAVDISTLEQYAQSLVELGEHVSGTVGDDTTPL